MLVLDYCHFRTISRSLPLEDYELLFPFYILAFKCIVDQFHAIRILTPKIQCNFILKEVLNFNTYIKSAIYQNVFTGRKLSFMQSLFNTKQ